MAGLGASARRDLERAARDRWTIEHGRIDCGGQPRPVFALLLRVGAMVRYEASLTHQFHEQVESWVDARTGLPPPEPALDALLGQHRLPDPDVRHATLPARLELALGAGPADLERRAAARAARLLEHGRRAHHAELARADDYYRGALESIERRRVARADASARGSGRGDARARPAAARDRGAVPPAPRAAAVSPAPRHGAGVRDRRRVRRGARRYPLELVWLAGGAGFANLRCPGCDGVGELVAGRERLGCHTCLPRPPAAADGGDRRRASGSTAVEGGARASAAAAAGTAAVRRRLAAERGRGAPRAADVEERGNKLALELWQRVALG